MVRSFFAPRPAPSAGPGASLWSAVPAALAGALMLTLSGGVAGQGAAPATIAANGPAGVWSVAATRATGGTGDGRERAANTGAEVLSAGPTGGTLGDAFVGAWSGRPWSLWRDPRAGWTVAAAGWLVGLVAALSAVAASRRAERRARNHIARVTRARDRLAVAHADLERSNARLEQANEQLERFANVAAHDLRAPLRALMTLPGWLREELTEAGIILSGDVSGMLDDIFDQAACMDQMLKDLLDYARLGGDGAERTLFQPAERIDGIARMAGMPDEFTLEIVPDMPELELSTVEFDTVMRNLLSNAVKHHDRQNGRIAVRGWRDGAAAVLEVEDDGPGIAPEHRERVFEIFSTLGPRETTAGGGMGLAFVRRIVEGWGGRVQVRAPAAGRGAVFRLNVPAPAFTRQEDLGKNDSKNSGLDFAHA